MVAQAKQLPPGERDFEIYRMTAVEGLSTRNVAAIFQISQTRVIQIRNRVFEWIGRHVPPLDDLFPSQRLAAAQQLAVERLEYLYGEALESWRSSQGDYSVTRLKGTQPGEKVTTYRVSHGNTTYLALAMRIAKELGKYGVARAPVPMEEDLAEESLESVLAGTGANPPDEDCSAEIAGAQQSAADDGPAGDVTTVAAGRSAAHDNSHAAGKQSKKEPARTVQAGRLEGAPAAPEVVPRRREVARS